jgi:hypothetical protein
MAKLKMFIKNNYNLGPSTQGYINVVDNLVETPGNLDDFLEAEPGERADILNTYAGRETNADGSVTILNVQHEKKGGGGSVPISKDNCRILLELDHRTIKRKSKHTISVPEEFVTAVSPPDLSYLQPYIDIIVSLDASNKPKAQKFLFGIMLLTRCR